MVTLKHTTIPYLATAGATQLNHVTCKGSVNSAGSMIAKECTLEKVKSAGSSILEKCQLQHLRGSGSTRLVESSVESVKTAGDLEITQSKIGQIQHAGRLRIQNSTIQGNVSHAGKVEILNSTIQDTLESCAQHIKIHESQIKNILVKPQKTSGLQIFGYDVFALAIPSKKQTVELIGGNCSVGSIIFEKKCNGLVVQKEGAVAQKILHF